MSDRGRISRRRHPFWLPASTFYFLSVAIAIGLFFFLWAVLNDGGLESPWIPAGLAASLLMISAVVLREVILSEFRRSMIAKQRRLDNSVLSAPIPLRSESSDVKLTLEKNALLLSDIWRKSEAANVLSSIAESHREVFELCDAYIELASRELPKVGPGSPRIVALMKGKNVTEDLHRSHMLKWAEIEARSFAQAATLSERAATKLTNAKKAQMVVNTALARYPEEASLLDSKTLLDTMVFSLKIASRIEKAEGALDKDDVISAEKHYREAAKILERELNSTESNAALADKIAEELEILSAKIVKRQ